MRTILTFIHPNSLSRQLRLRMRLIGLLGLLVTAAILASSGKARIAHTPAAPMPNLRGEAATEYLKQQGLYNSLGEAVKAARYGVYPSSPREGEERGEAFYADNPWQRWRAGFTPDGLSLRGGEAPGAGWELGMKLRSAGYGERRMAISAGRLSAKGDRIEYERTVGSGDCGLRIADCGLRIDKTFNPDFESAVEQTHKSAIRNPQSAIIEWYVNKAEGLEQGFTLAAPVAKRVGEEPLVLRLEVTGDLRAHAEADGQSVTLLRKSGERAVAYNHLAVMDAEGRKLPAHLEAAGGEVRIVVDDRGASYPVTIDPTFTEIKKLTASDGEESDRFGASVAIHADTAIVGAFGDDIGSNLNQGSAYIFERNQGGANNWGEVKKLIASDGAEAVDFGESVAIHADTAIVGAPFDGIGSNFIQGAAYIFERNQGGADNWGEVKKLTASDGAMGDAFGDWVAIHADTAIVGAPGGTFEVSSDFPGAAYVFERNQGGANNWGEVKKLIASDGAEGDRFGESVAIHADTAIVMASSDEIGSNQSQGSAYIFERNQGGANNWGEVKKLIASDGAEFDGFGDSVAIHADTAIVGAQGDDIGSNMNQGSAYIFERNQGGANNWGEVKKLIASDGAEGDQFGESVAIHADTAIVGAGGDAIGGNDGQGSAYIFERNQGGANNWGEVKKLIASDGAGFDRFGSSVAIHADTAIVGARVDDIGGNDAQGSAYVFERTNQPPDCSGAQPSVSTIWPPNHKFVNVTIQGVTDPDGDPVSITIDQIKQDEPTDGLGDGHTCPDAQGIGTSTAQVRAERSALGNGRVYTIFFTASDGKGGSCQGSVTVCVPRTKNGSCVNDGANFDSTDCSGFSGGQFCLLDPLLHLLGLPGLCLP